MTKRLYSTSFCYIVQCICCVGLPSPSPPLAVALLPLPVPSPPPQLAGPPHGLCPSTKPYINALITYWSLIPRALGVNSINMLSQLSLAAAYILETTITVYNLIKYVPLSSSVCHPIKLISSRNLQIILLSYFKYFYCCYLLTLRAGLQKWGSRAPSFRYHPRTYSSHPISYHTWFLAWG
jgi:hypothetical protein